MTLSAWRPLKDAPRDKPVVVDSFMDGMVVAFCDEVSGWFYWRAGHPQSLGELEPYKPIADTYELDRAVQGEIARAFGELLGGLKVASQHEYLARRAHSWSRSAREQSATDHRRNAVSNFRRILHTAMGGRIPDEVP